MTTLTAPPPTAGGTELLSYRGYRGALRGPLGGAWAIARTGLWTILRRKLFWGLYGLWLVLGASGGRRIPWREVALVGGAAVAMLALWFVPEYIGSGSALRAASRARQPNPDSAAFASFPFAAVFRRSNGIMFST